MGFQSFASSAAIALDVPGSVFHAAHCARIWPFFQRKCSLHPYRKHYPQPKQHPAPMCR